MGESSYISGGLPFFLFGCGLTPVPELSDADARELARIILEDVAVKNDTPKGRTVPAYSGKHISYTRLGKRFRGSDKAERVYASVKIFMRARLLQCDACREVAKILGFRLGNSKRGRPAKNPRHRKQKHEIVRSMYNSFARRNPWPPPENSATFVDSRAEFWYHYATTIRAWRNGSLVICPREWKPAATASIQTPDGQVWTVPFPQETLPGPKILASIASKLAKTSSSPQGKTG